MAKYYDLTVLEDEKTKKVADVVCVKKEIRKEREILIGYYVIETTHKEYEDLEIWNIYV